MDDQLDLRGLKCPLPALMTRRALAKLASGTRLAVVADDPLAAVDIPHMCHHEGHAVESVTRDGTSIRLVLRVRPDSSAGAAPPTDPDAPPHRAH